MKNFLFKFAIQVFVPLWEETISTSQNHCRTAVFMEVTHLSLLGIQAAAALSHIQIFSQCCEPEISLKQVSLSESSMYQLSCPDQKYILPSMLTDTPLGGLSWRKCRWH